MVMFTLMDMTGQRHGRLTVVHRIPAKGQARWLCRCDCGQETTVRGSELREGKTLSCGCWRRERVRRASTTHGHAPRGAPTATYRTWTAMQRRCRDTRDVHWPQYGGRGIRVCDRWMDYAAFLADMGERPTGLTLDRIDNDRDYAPDNCRWATGSQQSNNTRLTHLMTHDGRTQSLSAWARELGLTRWQIYSRIEAGASDDEALTG